MFLVGLTGGIATGKSLVSAFILDNNIPVIDADQIARKIVEPGEPANLDIKSKFENNVMKANGEVDRTKLGEEIFNDVEKKKLLNSITHPYIHAEIRKEIFKYFLKGFQFVVIDLPLLYETGKVLPFLHKTILVASDPETQLERLMKRNGYNKADALKRINAQMPLEEKISLADFVIDNSTTVENTRKETLSIIKHLKSSNQHLINRSYILGFIGSGVILCIYLVLLLCRLL